MGFIAMGINQHNHPGSYILNNSGYRIISINGKRVLAHRLVMENHLRKQLGKNEMVHHKNGDKTDNRLANLECITRKIHNQIHKRGKQYPVIVSKNMGRKKGCIPWNMGIAHSEETRAKISAALKGRRSWNLGKHHTEETKRKISIARKKR